MKNRVYLGYFWVWDTVKRANNAAREFAEKDGFWWYRLSCFFTVISVIQSNTGQFAGGGNWSHYLTLAIVSFFTGQTWNANFCYCLKLVVVNSILNNSLLLCSSVHQALCSQFGQGIDQRATTRQGFAKVHYFAVCFLQSNSSHLSQIVQQSELYESHYVS